MERQADAVVRSFEFVGRASNSPAGPQNTLQYAEDILWSKKIPIFATSSQRIRKYDGGVLNDVETGMMEKRWKYFEFSKPVQSPKEIKPCPMCFANFIFS